MRFPLVRWQTPLPLGMLSSNKSVSTPRAVERSNVALAR